MPLSPLTAISPIDGRYHKSSQPLSDYFSEFALIRYRLHVEVEYFIFFSEKKFFKLDAKVKHQLRNIVVNSDISQAEIIKRTEQITNHDVKAVEYFLKDEVEKLSLADLKEWNSTSA